MSKLSANPEHRGPTTEPTTTKQKWKTYLEAAGIIAAIVGVTSGVYFGIQENKRRALETSISVRVDGSFNHNSRAQIFAYDGDCEIEPGAIIAFPFTVSIANLSQRDMTIETLIADPVRDERSWGPRSCFSFEQGDICIGVNDPLIEVPGPATSDYPFLVLQPGYVYGMPPTPATEPMIDLPYRIEAGDAVNIQFTLGWPVGCSEWEALKRHIKPEGRSASHLLSTLMSILSVEGTSLGRAQTCVIPIGDAYVPILRSNPRQALVLTIDATLGSFVSDAFSFEKGWEYEGECAQCVCPP